MDNGYIGSFCSVIEKTAHVSDQAERVSPVPMSTWRRPCQIQVYMIQTPVSTHFLEKSADENYSILSIFCCISAVLMHKKRRGRVRLIGNQLALPLAQSV